MNGPGTDSSRGNSNPSFEEILRRRIIDSPSKVAKGVLKVVLGEFQQKNSNGKATEQDGYSIIEKVISGNKETLGFLKSDDPRRAALEEETRVVSSLLPAYLTEEQLLSKMFSQTQLLADVMGAKGDGQATGVVVKWCKSEKIEVKGDTVKAVVQKMRAGV